jgi:hypothetical protein
MRATLARTAAYLAAVCVTGYTVWLLIYAIAGWPWT